MARTLHAIVKDAEDMGVPAALEAAAALLDAGADVNARDATGRTPLDAAVFEANLPELAALFVARGGAPRSKRAHRRFLARYRRMCAEAIEWDVEVECGLDGRACNRHVALLPPGFVERQGRILDALRAHGGPRFADVRVGDVITRWPPTHGID